MHKLNILYDPTAVADVVAVDGLIIVIIIIMFFPLLSLFLLQLEM